jgi:hypothetical protein
MTNQKEEAFELDVSEKTKRPDSFTWQHYYNGHTTVPFDFSSQNQVEKQLDKVINTLPDKIKRAVINNSFIEKLITVYTSTVVSGSLSSGIWVNYDNKLNYTALYLMVVFPASSGKGSATMSRLLLSKINDSILEAYNNDLNLYKEEIRLYRRNPTGFPPERPKLKLVLAPGNTSSAKLIEFLADIDGEEILTMFETEMDAVGISSNGDFGNMNSSIFRQAFHHETVSKAIKKDGEIQIANTPKLSIVITGTLNQVGKILHSNADGLVSRFLFLMGDPEVKWKTTQPCDECLVQDEQFKELSLEYFEMWKWFKNKDIQIKFSQCQWDAIQEFGKQYLMYTYHFTSESAVSLPKRHALMICRMAAIFTMFRIYDQKLDQAVVYCNDEDFGNALWLVEYSLHCSVKLFKTLPGEKDEAKVADKKMLFLKTMPMEFTTEETRVLLTKLSISDRTISRWITEFISAGYLDRIKPGLFRKTTMAAMALATMEN